MRQNAIVITIITEGLTKEWRNNCCCYLPLYISFVSLFISNVIKQLIIVKFRILLLVKSSYQKQNIFIPLLNELDVNLKLIWITYHLIELPDLLIGRIA